MEQSPFDLQTQNARIESRIVAALERISEAFRVLLWNESKENALSPIQIQILIFLLFHTPEKCKVSYLANEFNMTKATVSDSVKTLLQKGLVAKQEDVQDTRSFSIALTHAGEQAARKASLFAGQIEAPLSQLTAGEQAVMLNGLLRLIHDLNKAGVITTQRMCFTCTHYRSGGGGGHYCTLLGSALADSDLRIDCPEHESAA